MPLFAEDINKTEPNKQKKWNPHTLIILLEIMSEFIRVITSIGYYTKINYFIYYKAMQNLRIVKNNYLK